MLFFFFGKKKIIKQFLLNEWRLFRWGKGRHRWGGSSSGDALGAPQILCQDNPPTLSPWWEGLTQAEGKHPVAQGVATLEEKISCCWPDVKGRVEEAGVEQSQERQTDRQSPGLGVGADPPPR